MPKTGNRRRSSTRRVITERQLNPVNIGRAVGVVKGVQVTSKLNQLQIKRISQETGTGTLSIEIPRPESAPAGGNFTIRLDVNESLNALQLGNAVADSINKLGFFTASVAVDPATREGVIVHLNEPKDVFVPAPTQRRRGGRNGRRREVSLGVSPEAFAQQRRRATAKLGGVIQDLWADFSRNAERAQLGGWTGAGFFDELRQTRDNEEVAARARFQNTIALIDAAEVKAQVQEQRAVVAEMFKEEAARKKNGEAGWQYDFVATSAYLSNPDGFGPARAVRAVVEAMREAGIAATATADAKQVTVFGTEADWRTALQAVADRVRVPLRYFDDDGGARPFSSAILTVGADVSTDRGHTEYSVTLVRDDLRNKPTTLTLPTLPSATDLDIVVTEAARASWKRSLEVEIARCQIEIDEGASGAQRSKLTQRIWSLRAQLQGQGLDAILGQPPEVPTQAPEGAVTTVVEPWL